MMRAQYTEREIKRLQLGWAIRQRESKEAARSESGRSSSMRRQSRKISRNHRSKTEQMFRDLKQN